MVDPSSFSSLAVPSSPFMNALQGDLNMNSLKNPLAAMKLPMNFKLNSGGKMNSLYIYFKLFIYYPAKYLILLYILVLILFLLNESYNFAIMAYYKIWNFFKILIACSQMKKCDKKNKGTNCCELNLIIFTVPDIFKLFMGVLDLLLGVVYAFVAFFILIAAALCTIPFSIIIPYYRALL